VLVVAGSLVLVVCGDDDLVVGIDRIVFIIDCVSGANLWSFLIILSSMFLHEGHGKAPTVSNAIARGRPFCCFSASLAWSITDWWY
jgi:hypothetical protein